MVRAERGCVVKKGNRSRSIADIGCVESVRGHHTGVGGSGWGQTRSVVVWVADSEENRLIVRWMAWRRFVKVGTCCVAKKSLAQI